MVMAAALKRRQAERKAKRMNKATVIGAGLAGVEAHAVVAVDKDVRQTVLDHEIEQFFVR